MKEHTLRVLEFFQFLDLLQEYTLSEVGRSNCLSLRPRHDIEKINILYGEVAEVMEILRVFGDLPLAGLYDLRTLLQASRAEGFILSPENFLKIKSTLGVAEKVKLFGQTFGPKYHHLQRWITQIPPLSGLYHTLCSTLGERGEILDSASANLQYLRLEIINLRTKIRKKLESLWAQENLKNIFQEQILTIRNGRYVLAIKAEWKNSLPGIIHDQSQSGATFFIEPFATVEENNELNLLLNEEKEEERRILKQLTDLVRENSNEISQTGQVLGYLDLLFAKAKYALATKSNIPLLNKEGEICLAEARHPFIPSSSVVPINLELKKGTSTLIISGANAGGKTVALKTLGLLTILAHCGIPIPAASESRVSIFNHIFAEIGDEQSLQENLSTFSAWVQTICQILQEADENSLVLLDEVGRGTDPNEGAALTMALLDELRERGTKTVVTTHLRLLKAYGSAHPDVVNVSVEFDIETHRPTYKLIYGRPGESYALPMAQKCGLPSGLIEKAQKYIGEGERRINELIQKLEERERQTEAKYQEYERLREEQKKLNQETKIILQQLKDGKKIILEQFRQDTLHLIETAREELRKIINDFKTKGRTDVHSLEKVIKTKEEEIKAMLLAAEEDLPKAISGKEIFQHSLDAANGKKELSLRERKKVSIDFPIPNAPREINLIGLTVEDALPLVDKAIDEAFLAGLKELAIIHGAGTGRLRRAIRQHLQNHAFVKSFLPGSPGQGGDGVTVIEIAGASALPKRKTGREKIKPN